MSSRTRRSTRRFRGGAERPPRERWWSSRWRWRWVGSGLKLNSVLRLQAVNAGFDARNVLTMEIFLAGRHYWQPAEHLSKKVSPEATLFYQELLSRIERLPGVQSAGMIGQLPTRWLE